MAISGPQPAARLPWTRSVSLILLALACASLVQPLAIATDETTTILVNVQTVTSRGCGSWGDGPRLAYSIRAENAEASWSALDRRPVGVPLEYFELLRIPTRSTVTNLTFTVVDDAGIFGQTACNVSGDATSYQIPYHTGASRKIDVSGSGTVPVRLVAYISDTTIDNVTPPKLFLQSEPTSHSISLGWEAYAVPNASRAALVDVANGQEIASFTPNVAGHDDLDCLRPNRTSSIELRAIGARFAVGSAHLRFTTLLGSECTPAAHNVPIVDAFGLVVALVAGWTATSARRAGGTRGAA